MTKDTRPFLLRFYTYQAERFPFLAHGLLITAFTFSAISYSRLSRGLTDFIELKPFLVALFNTFTLFFLLRIFDEFKDKEDDAKYRSYLPVPRGVISLKELFRVAVLIIIAQVLVNAWFYPRMLGLYGFVMAYLLLMGKEFFIPAWLKKHQFWYVVSHMFIIPLVDIYASGFDWFLGEISPPSGLALFFGVSYMNGIVLEVGRKIKTPEKEEEGVLSYTSLLGHRRAPAVWILMLLVTLAFAIFAARAAGHSSLVFLVLAGLFCLCAMPAFLFINRMTDRRAKFIEYASALWTIGMYLSLGGIPMLTDLLNG